jgi:pimeloyl-ACP methyl ester carboxylesterase
VVCPDLRGHGDSAWSPDGNYAMPFFVSDLAQLISQFTQEPVPVVGHSLGAAIALHYAGIFPERVSRVVAIEGLGVSPLDRKPDPSIVDLWRTWIEDRALPARQPKSYPSLDEACDRMRQNNPHLSEDHVRHLTFHGTRRSPDGGLTWKFDDYLRSLPPGTMPDQARHAMWRNIDCPVWLVHGADSWARDPGKDGRADHFQHATVTSYENAGHWVHHDRFQDFVRDLQAWL